MKEFTDSEIQSLWDECLIKGWKSDIHMTMVLKQFLVTVKPDLLFNGHFDMCSFRDIGEAIDYVNSLEIRRRCRDRAGDGGLEFRSVKAGVRAFIARRSPMLSNCLMSGVISNEEILGTINNYKWSRVQEKKISAKRQRTYYAYKKASGEKTIEARSLGKKHDWGTVK